MELTLQEIDQYISNKLLTLDNRVLYLEEEIIRLQKLIETLLNQ
jgi:hypothetical protein